nr:zinc-binding dehydrogenase [Angustibacter aerolatus]
MRRGDFVVAPFALSDGTCAHCRHGVQTSCERGAAWGATDRDGYLVDGGQGEAVRVAMADGTLVAVPGHPDDAMLPSLLALSDVMGTGHHAALAAGVGPGQTVVVVGDGAVGLCAVLAARRLGAERVIAMSRHTARQAVALDLGADDVVAERGEEGVARIEEAHRRRGRRRGARVRRHEGVDGAGDRRDAARWPRRVRRGAGRRRRAADRAACSPTTSRSAAASRRCGSTCPSLLEDVLSGAIEPGKVFDVELPLSEVATAYTAMDQRTAIKTLLRP